MQQEWASPTNGNRFKSVISSLPFPSPDQRIYSPPYLANGGDYLRPLLHVYTTEGDDSDFHQSVPRLRIRFSHPPSFFSFDGEDPTATENCLYLAGLSLQYQEIEDRYELCLSHLQEATREAEALRQENAQLRIANDELAKRLSLLTGKPNVWIATSSAMSIVEEFHRLSVGSPTAVAGPTSVLGFEENRFGRWTPEKRVSLPKSISIRSSGYLKLNPPTGTSSPSNRNGQSLPVSKSVMVGSETESTADPAAAASW